MEGFTYFKPGEIDRRVTELSKEKNKKYFSPIGVYAGAAKKWSWLDPVTYYDLVDLQYNKKYDPKNIRKVFEH